MPKRCDWIQIPFPYLRPACHHHRETEPNNAIYSEPNPPPAVEGTKRFYRPGGDRDLLPLIYKMIGLPCSFAPATEFSRWGRYVLSFGGAKDEGFCGGFASMPPS